MKVGTGLVGESREGIGTRAVDVGGETVVVTLRADTGICTS